MSIFDVMLALCTLLCSLVAGLLFAYAIVIMPGIKNLEDKQFIKAFQVTDRVIQDNHPVFLFVWVGSAISLIFCAFTGFSKLQGLDFFLLLSVTAAYLAGVQISTIAIHLSLNNKLQACDVETISVEELHKARIGFEPRWNQSTQIRTIIACVVIFLLIVLALRQ
ncbi:MULTISPECIES: DUF1772 domain-containing protein [unclassified Oleiphilus]|uniref:anthrone oxygenase family protein n=3 Tax=Oleiphilus TaxID=141450 RepID=UPI0007C386EE|nr:MULTISPECIES: anthrone oxygenase family protein [unclassified Oleiphilus]KZY64307.1 hypothetical protein A3738_10525 [Oleiphilus sp. HI0066]KZY66979.1 hypothetical protein A3739_13170 [Oleiphilus sp. HI0067]